MPECRGDVIVHHSKCRRRGADVTAVGSDRLLDDDDSVTIVDIADLDGRRRPSRPLVQRGVALNGTVRVADLDVGALQRRQGTDVRVAQRIVKSKDGGDLRSAHED